jgi:hypothetical protein
MPVADLAALRRRLQRALLGVLRRDSPGLALANLEACLGELKANSEQPAAHELWGAAICLVRGLRVDSDPPDQASLRLLGQLDRALRTQLLEGEDALAEPSFDDLAEAFRGHPRSLDTDTVESAPKSPDNLAGLTAAMNVLSKHPVWSPNEPIHAGGGGEEEGLSSPTTPVESSTSAGSATAEIRDEEEDDFDSNDRVPLANVRSRLAWVVRQAGRELGRPVELHWVGNAQLPRARLRRLLPHLECLARNSVYFGVATPEVRVAVGLPAVAPITFAARNDSSSGTVLELHADGLALDLNRLRRRAEEVGLINHSETDIAKLLALLLRPGFSTAHRATQVAGYGVGMDAAAQAFSAISGRLELELAADGGLRLEMRIPG